MNGFPAWVTWALVVAVIAGTIDIFLYLGTDAIPQTRTTLVRIFSYLGRAFLLVFTTALSTSLLGIAITLLGRKQ